MRHVMDLSRELVRRGHTVHIIYSPRRMEDAFKERFLNQANEGITLHPVEMRRAPHPSDRKAIKAAREILKTHQFDVVHCHSTKSGLVGRLAAKGLRAKVFYTPHGIFTLSPDIKAWQRVPYAKLEAWLQKYTTRVIYLSEIEKIECEAIGIRREKLVQVFNGIEAPNWADREELRKRYGIENDEVVVGWISRFLPAKDPDLAIETFAEVAANNSHARFLMAGEGDLWDDAKEYAASLGLQNRLTFVGTVRPAEFFPALDIQFLSSLQEGLPYVLVEALFAGLPIVSTRVGGTHEIVRNNGRVSNERDASELSDLLIDLINQPALRERMGEESLLLSKKFTIDSMVDSLVSLYRTAS